MTTALTGFNINNFRSNINTGGYLQTNKFSVVISVPPKSIYLGPTSSQHLSFRADEVRVPGASLDIASIHRYGIGPNQKFPFNVNFTDITISFIDDASASIWHMMNTWMRAIFGYGNNNISSMNKNSQNYQLLYKDEYCSTIQINVFNNYGAQVQMIELIDAFPISLNDVTLSWGNNNNLYKTHATFNFRDYNASISGENQVLAAPGAPGVPQSGQFIVGLNGLPIGATT